MYKNNKRNWLAEIWAQKSDTVARVSDACDVRVSVYKRSDIVGKIAIEDPIFHRSVIQQGSLRLSFSYGDKYFMPLDDEHLACIPVIFKNWYEVLKSLNYPKELCDWARTDEAKLRSKIKKSGYFDTSGFARYSVEFEITPTV